ncbi:MAG: biotin transporter BioY [Clostridia bacterium]|nr:biotin transporter BioY [Clostridia bacterium]
MKLTVKDMVLCSFFAALISISAYLSLPSPTGVPFSLQPLFAMMAGAFLGSKRGAIAMTVYMLIGLIGIPVFSNGTGGFGVILSPTFGYIIGFIAMAFVVGKVVEMTEGTKAKLLGLILAPVLGVAVNYMIGVPYLLMIFNVVKGAGITFYVALTYGFFPYILLDLIKAGLVVMMLMSIVPKLRLAGALEN